MIVGVDKLFLTVITNDTVVVVVSGGIMSGCLLNYVQLHLQCKERLCAHTFGAIIGQCQIPHHDVIWPTLPLAS